MKKGKLLSSPTRPIEVSPGMSCSDLLTGLEGCSFQGRRLGRAAGIWTRALDEDVTVWFGLSGAMVPAGMRKVVVSLLERRFIDVVVSTGANLYHDFHETIGNYHYLGSHHADDRKLREERIDRIYDTYADEKEFIALDKYIGKWAVETLEDRSYFSSCSDGKRVSGRKVKREYFLPPPSLECRSTAPLSGIRR